MSDIILLGLGGIIQPQDGKDYRLFTPIYANVVLEAANIGNSDSEMSKPAPVQLLSAEERQVTLIQVTAYSEELYLLPQAGPGDK